MHSTSCIEAKVGDAPSHRALEKCKDPIGLVPAITWRTISHLLERHARALAYSIHA